MNDPFLYEGTEVLINKANIREQKKLDNFESIKDFMKSCTF